MASAETDAIVVLVVADSCERFCACLDTLEGCFARVQCEADPKNAPERVRELRPNLVVIAVERAEDLGRDLVDAVRSVGGRIRALVETTDGLPAPTPA